MRIFTRFGLMLALFGASASFLRAAPATAPAEIKPIAGEQAKATDFLRFVDKGSSGGRLETADIAYRNADGVTVHLVAAVHIGERDYFEGLNQSFKLRDAVLYEMVKPKDQPAPEHGQQSTSSISQFQRMLKDQLDLEFQLDVVDYSAPNFIHADLDAETFEKMQNERGESMMMLMLKSMFQQMSKPQPEMTEEEADKQIEDLVHIFTRPDSSRQLKLLLAKNLAQMEEGGMGLDVMGGTVILTERNKAAMKTLEHTLKDGKKDIAIFYGAAHMPELSKQLTDMGFKPVASEWRMAWDLTIRADEPSAVEQIIIEALKAMKDM